MPRTMRTSSLLMALLMAATVLLAQLGSSTATRESHASIDHVRVERARMEQEQEQEQPGRELQQSNPLDLILPFGIEKVPLLEPWENNSTAVQGNAAWFDASTAIVELGPCVWREFHWHANAWEIFTVMSGVAIKAYILDKRGTLTIDTVKVGESIGYPQGWTHAQFNDNCEGVAKAVLVFSKKDAGQTFHLVDQAAKIPGSYQRSVFGREFSHGSWWVKDLDCVERCKRQKRM